MNSAPFANLSANERRILEIIWQAGPIARADIATLTALTGASVTRLTQALDERGLISETVKREGLRGQPSRPVQIRGAGACAAGINFSHHHMQVGIVDLSGRLLCSDTKPLPEAEPALIADTAWVSLNTLLTQSGVDRQRLAGVGIALPGDFLADATLQAHAFFPMLAERDLYQEFSARIPAPVFLENDSNAAALGERVLGAGRGYNSFIFVHIGHGVGGGLVLGGELYRGEHGNAGIIGVLFPNDAPRPSGQDLLQTLAAAGIAVDDFQELENLDPAEHPALADWLERAGEQLRGGLYLVARIVDPAAVIVGGRLPVALLKHITAVINAGEFAPPHDQLPRPQILTSALGSRAGLIGTAIIPLYRTFFDSSDRTGNVYLDGRQRQA